MNILETNHLEFDDEQDRFNYLRLKYNVINEFIYNITKGEDKETLRMFYKGLINLIEFKLEEINGR